MSKLLNIALATALGFAVSTPLFAADTYQGSRVEQSAAWSDADVSAALNACDDQTGTAQARCIVNIRPTLALSQAEYTNYSSAPDQPANQSPAAGNTVRDGTSITDAAYAAAVKECESQHATDQDRCVKTATERFGRM
jgi:hypothetical protein